jgi:hypothetical protein
LVRFEFSLRYAEKKKNTSPIYPQSQDKVGDQRIKILLSEDQRTLLMSNCKRLILKGPYGSGKSLLLRQKALILAAKGEQVAFLVGGRYNGEPSTASHFHDLTRQDFENTKVKFPEA